MRENEKLFIKQETLLNLNNEKKNNTFLSKS